MAANDVEMTLAELMATAPVEIGSWDPVNPVMVRHWCEVMGIANPAYSEAGAVPAGMLHVWTMPGFAQRFPDGPAVDLLRQASNRLSRLGYTGVVAVQIAQDYLRPLRIGERLWRRMRIERISAPKATAVGEGIFVTEMAEIFSGEELVGTTRLRLLCFRPDAMPCEREAALATLAGNEDDLPDIDITARFIVAAAIATRDFEDVHLDRECAQRRGLRDIYLNIMTSVGLVQRCVEDAVGPDVVISGMDIRLLAPAFPGDRLRLRCVAGQEGGLDVELFHDGGCHARGRVIQAAE